MISDKMLEAALGALEGKTLDGRQFWTTEEMSLMRGAIEAALAIGNTERRLEKLESMGFVDASDVVRGAIDRGSYAYRLGEAEAEIRSLKTAVRDLLAECRNDLPPSSGVIDRLQTLTGAR